MMVMVKVMLAAAVMRMLRILRCDVDIFDINSESPSFEYPKNPKSSCLHRFIHFMNPLDSPPVVPPVVPGSRHAEQHGGMVRQRGGRHILPELHRWIPDLQESTPAAAQQTPPRHS